jgi:hypothetical protein
MRRLGSVLILFVALASQASAGEFLNKIAGVYKTRFQNGTVDGHKYMSEDILEITPYGDSAAYVRYHLEFFNGHVCDVSGIAEERGQELVYDELQPPRDKDHCRLTMHLSGDELVTEDKSPQDGSSGCRVYCGARGSFDGTKFPFSAKRSIRYMPRLLKSNEYQEAVKDYERAKSGSPRAEGTK